MISLKQINNQHVKPIPIPSALDKRPIKGYDVCEHIYANIFACAKKNTGKTNATFKLMKECANKHTHIIVFCSTVFKDEAWIEIVKFFENKGMDIRVFTSLFEDGEDQLQKLLDELDNEAKEEETKDEHEEQPEIDRCDDILQRLTNMHHGIPESEEQEEKKKKKKKSKFRCQDYLIILDDLSSELKSKSLLFLLKRNRHYRSKIIISSQWLHDLLPESRKQIDLFMIFKGFPEKKLQEIYKDCDSSVPFDLFCKIYRKATKKPHSFMYIDSRKDTFRSNFDRQFILDIHDEN